MSIHTIYAEDNKWIDGIKFRVGENLNRTIFKMPWDKHDNKIIDTPDQLAHLDDAQPLFPVSIELPETLMNSWSFRGAILEFHTPFEMKDLAPYNIGVGADTSYGRQRETERASLYKHFFNASDKSFADAHSNWALSADIKSSRIVLGYYWGVFIPAFWNQRLMKVGMGLGAYYWNFSYNLNLCSQYKVTPLSSGKHSGECVGKTEIDSASSNGFGFAEVAHLTFWERHTENSIWKIGSGSRGTNSNWLSSSSDSLKLKNHDRNLEVEMQQLSVEYISYTYRF